MNNLIPILFACDHGAKLCLEPISNAWGIPLTENLPFVNEFGPSVLILGTSTSSYGNAQDEAACRWASLSGIPVIVIEDFPGNGSLLIQAAAKIDKLVVESDFSVRHYQKLGFPNQKLVVLPPLRYDLYRGFFRNKLQDSKRFRAVLWAGQPESFLTKSVLGWMAPWLKQHGFTVYFRAHPRDHSYKTGFWHKWLEQRKLRWVDCTSWDEVQLWDAPIRFVATAFSSLAITASFHGIPAIFVLHQSSIKRLLHEQKAGIRPSVVAIGACATTFGPFVEKNMNRCLSIGEIKRMKQTFELSYRTCQPVVVNYLQVIHDIIQQLHFGAV